VSRWCVFTSAGDYSNVCSWLAPRRSKSWDLIVAFYGDNDAERARLTAVADKLFPMRGSKFQNLLSLYRRMPELFSGYEYIWVADDDLMLDPYDIDRLFKLAARHDLWICQPAFSSRGRISHGITAQQNTYIRITNFVEVTCPLFRADKLREFLQIYDGELVGWGIDWWYCNALNISRNGKAAVIDSVVVTNPHSNQRRGGKREIESLQSDAVRQANWQATASRLHLQEYELQTLAQINETRLQVLTRRAGRLRRKVYAALSRPSA
jgi:Protein of unknown function (DUF707)